MGKPGYYKYRVPALLMPLINLLPTAISDLFAQASVTGRMTLADRYGLMAALLDESIGEEEMYCIDRLLYALRKGRVEVVNELSAVL
ncbi:hypothetical protein [Pantanalinema sp. GBBB05]|uniref:hypothetical protein n=1 Tax=Pantanalinema sp. GBBB05 TaxID=2604139 RepID=UPI003D81C2C8